MSRLVTVAALAALAAVPFLASAGEEPVGFPASWEGVWKGDLVIERAGAARQVVPMSLVVKPTEKPDRWAFRIRYGEQPERPYEIVVVDVEEGRYDIDEGNSIVVPSRLVGGELVSVFEVSGNRIAARYRREGEKLVVDILMSGADATGTTGGGNGVPEVKVFAPLTVQRAVLAR